MQGVGMQYPHPLPHKNLAFCIVFSFYTKKFANFYPPVKIFALPYCARLGIM